MDTFSKRERSKIMSKIKSKNTTPEVIFRKVLHKEGYKYRLHYGKERIDIALTDKKVAIFIDGCFWHSCPKHLRIPKSNRAYWIPKLTKNIVLAKDKDRRLRKGGWKVLHIWEHELKSASGTGSATSKVKALYISKS